MYDIPNDPMPSETSFTPDPPPTKKREGIDWSKIAITLFLLCGIVLTIMGQPRRQGPRSIGVVGPQGQRPPMAAEFGVTFKENLRTLRQDWKKLISTSDTANQWDPGSGSGKSVEQVESGAGGE